jgi:hypothetical protein
MKIRKIHFYFLCIIVGFVSCSKNDGTEGLIVVPEADRTEQQVIDRDSLLGYLETHYYNSGTFVNNTNPSINDLIISEVPSDGVIPDPANNTLLIDAVEIKNTIFSEVDYEYYVLRINQGGGPIKPHFTDDVRVNFIGNLLNEEVFDSTSTPIDFDLAALVIGWGRVLREFNTAESFIENSDGTVDFTNAGVGVMFIPSGLGFFASSPPSVPLFSPLIFKFELFQSEINDHDSDGIPSYLEDLDNDLDVTDHDTNGDGLLNYLDPDDDGDFTLTIEEDLEDIDPNVDSSGDGILDNDLDGDGDPTNDDTDGDGIPNYLDIDSTVSNTDDDNS